MDKFKKIALEDREVLTHYLGLRSHMACDYSVGNLVLWSDVYKTHYLIAEDMLIIKYKIGDEDTFTFPIGNGDLKRTFEWLFAYCKDENIDFKMSIVEPTMFEEVDRLFPGMFSYSFNRDIADYVYKTEDLMNLSGKKYHGKKNHVNQFIRANENWIYERISEQNANECIEMVKIWCSENGCCEDKSKADEMCALIKAIKYRNELNLIGGIIRADDKIVALTLGEKSSEEMFIVHFEKALADVQGAYTMINQQFIINELSNFTYINREEDLGIEGLRKAKESYHPAFMVEKGTIKKK